MKTGLKSGGGEGMEEVFQGIMSNVAKQMGGVDVPVVDFKEAVEQFAGGALPGAFMGGAGGVVAARAAQDYSTDPADLGDKDFFNASDETPLSDLPTGNIEPETEIKPPIIDEAPSEPVASGPESENLEIDETVKKHWEPVKDKTDPIAAAGLQRLTGDTEPQFTIVEPKSKITKALASVSQKLTGQATNYFMPLNKATDRANGFVGSNGQLYINVNEAAKDPLITTGHEFGHFLKQTAGKDYEAFQKLIVGNLKENHSDYFQALVTDYQNSKIDLTGEQVVDEFTNDVLGDMFADGKFWNEVFSGEPTTAKQKLANLVVQYIKAMVKALKNINGTKQYLNNFKQIHAAAVKMTKAQIKTEAKITEEVKPQKPKPVIEPKKEVEPVTKEPELPVAKEETEVNPRFSLQSKEKNINAESDEARDHRDSDVKASDKVFELLEIPKGKIFADYGYLFTTKAHHFASIEELEKAAKFVLQNPDFITVESGGNKGLVRENFSSKEVYLHPKVKIRLKKQGKRYHIRSVHLLNDKQLLQQKKNRTPSEDNQSSLDRTDMNSSDQHPVSRVGSKQAPAELHSVTVGENQQRPVTDKDTAQSAKSQTEADYSLRRQANPVTEAGAVQDLNEAQKDDYEPDVHKIADLDRQADARIAKSIAENKNNKFKGERALIEKMAIPEKDIDDENKGYKAENDLDVRTMLKLVDSATMLKMVKDSSTVAADAMMKWIIAGTKAGQALNARKNFAIVDPSTGKIIFDYLAALKAALFATSEKYKKAETIEEKEKILQTYDKKKTGLAVKDLRKAGIDIENLTNEELIKDHKLFAKALRTIHAAKASKSDKAYEYWINGLLSLPKTQVANIVGNTVMAAMELVPQRFVEATLNLVAKKKNAATFGEFKHMWAGLRGNMKNAFLVAAKAWDDEMPRHTGEQKLEHATIAIRGKTGRFIRTFGRMLTAADEFAKALIIPVEANAMAYRIAKSEKLKDSALTDRMAELMADEDSEAMKWAGKRALELTFQTPGEITDWLIQAKAKGGILGQMLKWNLPFVRTSTNIIKTGLRKSPLGVLSLANDLARGKTTSEQNIRHAAEQVLAWGMLIALSSFTGDDDDEPMLTGTNPDKWYKNSSKWKRQHLPEHSIKIGGKWYSYARVEPLAGILSTIVDGLNAYRMAKNNAEGGKVMKQLMSSVRSNFTEKSFLQGIGDMVRMFDDGTNGLSSASNFMSSWIPNIVRGTLAATNENIPNTGTTKKGLEWFKYQLVNKTIHRALGNVTVTVPRYDIWGQPIRNQDVENMISPLAWRITSPMRVIDADMSQADSALYNWNKQNPEAEYWPSLPRTYYRRDGKSVYIKGDVYSEYVKRAGELAKKYVDKAIRQGRIDINKPTERNIKLYKKAFKAGRKKAFKEIVKK